MGARTIRSHETRSAVVARAGSSRFLVVILFRFPSPDEGVSGAEGHCGDWRGGCRRKRGAEEGWGGAVYGPISFLY